MDLKKRTTKKKMRTTKDTIPQFATHPGVMLLDEIEASEYSQSDLANLIGLKRSQLNEIIKGKRNINAEVAILLEKALEIDANFWLEAQKNYDLDKARIEEKSKIRLGAIEIWNLMKSLIPVSFFKKEQIITGDPIFDIDIIKDIYKVKSVDELATIRVQSSYERFKKSVKLKADVVNIMGWVKLVQFKAETLTVVPFDYDNKDKLVKELRTVFFENKNVLKRVQDILHANGIKLVYQSKGEKTPVDGVCFWSNGNPAIGMTLRYKKLDNFAFTLFHELGHIFQHLINNNTAEYIDLEIKNEEVEYKNSIPEKEADMFAQNALIKEQDWNRFKVNLAFKNNDEDIIAFAKQIKIDPSIVRGRICFTLNNFRTYSNISHAIN